MVGPVAASAFNRQLSLVVAETIASTHCAHHFHSCKAPLARASPVKWRFTKYLALTF